MGRWICRGSTAVNLQYAQALADPHSEHGNEADSPQDCDDSQIPAYHIDFVPDLILFSNKVSFSIVEDDVILFLHIEHAPIKEHHNGRASQHSLDNDQTHKGSRHLNLPRMETRCLIGDYWGHS